MWMSHYIDKMAFWRRDTCKRREVCVYIYIYASTVSNTEKVSSDFKESIITNALSIITIFRLFKGMTTGKYMGNHKRESFLFKYLKVFNGYFLLLWGANPYLFYAME